MLSCCSRGWGGLGGIVTTLVTRSVMVEVCNTGHGQDTITYTVQCHLDDGVEDEGGAVPPLEQHRQVPRHGCGVQRLVARRGQCTFGCHVDAM